MCTHEYGSKVSSQCCSSLPFTLAFWGNLSLTCGFQLCWAGRPRDLCTWLPVLQLWADSSPPLHFVMRVLRTYSGLRACLANTWLFELSLCPRFCYVYICNYVCTLAVAIYGSQEAASSIDPCFLCNWDSVSFICLSVCLNLDIISLYSSDWPGTHCIDQPGLEWQKSTCFYLPSSGTKAICHHTIRRCLLSFHRPSWLACELLNILLSSLLTLQSYSIWL